MKDALSSLPQGGSNPLRVLVTSYRSNPFVGGQGIYVRALTRALKEAGCEVSVASGPPYPDLDPGIALIELPSLDLFAEDNAMLALRPHHLRSKADRVEWVAHNTGAFGEMFSFAHRLNAYLATEGHGFDVVHDNQTLAPAMVSVEAKLPVLTTLHHPIAIDRDFAVAGADRWWKRLLVKRWHSFVETQAKAARALPRFLGVSEAARDSYARRCGIDPARVTVSLNGVDHGVFSPDATLIRDTDHIMTIASADVPIKGLDVLIDALALLKTKGRTPRLTVVGSLRDGPTKTALQRTGLMDQVNFVSGLSTEDLVELYRRCSVFVSASRFEGFGLPAAEAMACAAPVIVSDGGALPEVAGDAGIVTAAEDASSLCNALERVLGDERLRETMSAACLARAQAEFRWDKHAQSAIALYQKALADRTRAGVYAA